MTLHFRPATIGSGVAYIFPGQGAQFVGMGRQLHDESAEAREVFKEVDSALGRPLSKMLLDGPEGDLRETVNAQPAIMAVSLAAVNAMEALGGDDTPHPALIAGHSLGEYTSLAVAGVLDVGSTALLVQERGRLMQQACEEKPGSMAAILGLDVQTIQEIARETGTYVSNVNTAEQIVISGERISVAQSCDMALARGANKAIPLRVSGAFHSRLMDSARDGLIEAVDRLRFNDPTVPIVANCTGEALTTADQVKQELVTQISACVQWQKSVDYMIGSGVSRFIEIGPGRALASMVKRIDRSVDTTSVGDVDSIMALRRN